MTVNDQPVIATQTQPLPARAWAILAVVMIASMMDMLDSTIMSIAAPRIAIGLHGGPGLIKWLAAGYALSLGVLLVTGGRLGDKFGRRRTFIIGMAGFTLASLACGLAWDPASIVVARVVQGGFGALMIPQTFGILLAVFPRDKVAKAFSVYGPVLGLGSVGGPLLAGTLITANLAGLSWRPMFLINVVLGGVGLIASWRLVPHDSGERSTVIDYLGSILLAATMFGLIYGLIEGSNSGWGAASIVSLTVGVAFFAGFSWRQRRAPVPLIAPALLRNRGFTAGLVVSLLYFSVFGGLLYALSLYLQRGLHYTAFHTALVGVTPIAGGIVVASVVCMNLVAKLGRKLILGGIVVTAAGVGWLLLVLLVGGPATAASIAPAMAVVGLGAGPNMAALFDIALGNTGPDQAGSATGSLSSVQQLAYSIGPAIITTVYLGAASAGQAHAMTLSLAVIVGIAALSAVAVPLLPRKPRRGH